MAQQADDGDLLGPLREFFLRLYLRLGPRGRAAAAVLFVLILGWWNWDHIRSLPLVSPVVSRIFQGRIPHADPHRFAVALAHLEHDEGHQAEQLILDALEGFERNGEIQGVQILRFDRTIYTEGADPAEAEKNGHKEARKYLEKSGAQVLIWGAVIRQDGKSAPRLYWTTSEVSERPTQLYQPDNFQLPNVFWDQLVDVLGLMIVSQSAQVLPKQGQFISSQLRPFIEKVRNLLAQSEGEHGWSAESRARGLRVLADGFLVLGEQTGDNRSLQESMAACREALKQYTQQRVPLDWAMTENNLGVALAALGDREPGTEHLQEAVAAYRAALQERTRERVPLDWAATQNNLGVALGTLGDREPETEHLQEAVAAYRAALQEWTRERVPLDWATTQNNLGVALSHLGEREAGTEHLQEAVAAYRAALQEWTPERVPLDWADAQDNLGIALRILGEREPGTEHLQEAVAAFRAALQERTSERVPLDWANTQNNLGVALYDLGEREAGTEHLQEAVAAYRAALQEFTRERGPLQWAMTQDNLGVALAALGDREPGTEHLQEAVAAYRAALQEYTRERVPLDWARTQNNLGVALYDLGDREPGTEHLQEAVTAYRAALQERTRGRVPLDWANTQNNLGIVLRVLGDRTRDDGLICEGLMCQTDAWGLFSEVHNYQAAAATTGAKMALVLLKTKFDSSIYQNCIAKNEASLRQMGLLAAQVHSP